MSAALHPYSQRSCIFGALFGSAGTQFMLDFSYLSTVVHLDHTVTTND